MGTEKPIPSQAPVGDRSDPALNLKLGQATTEYKYNVRHFIPLRYETFITDIN